MGKQKNEERKKKFKGVFGRDKQNNCKEKRDLLGGAIHFGKTFPFHGLELITTMAEILRISHIIFMHGPPFFNMASLNSLGKSNQVNRNLASTQYE